MEFRHHDGGRQAAGFSGKAGDCVVRALAIAMERDYSEVYRELAEGNAQERQTKRAGRTSGQRSARNGINVRRKWFKDYMARHGWRWVPTMGIGTGCKVHLTDGELPMGRLIALVSRHYTTVIDGVIHDTHDPQREGEMRYGVVKMGGGWQHNMPLGRTGGRCVYGYWSKA